LADSTDHARHALILNFVLAKIHLLVELRLLIRQQPCLIGLLSIVLKYGVQ
jgi:hypothetical protein